jgi:hypothetical protein
MSNARELAELGGSYGTGGFVGMKNRIINGAMVIDQRNAGAAVTTDGSYPVDRLYTDMVQASKITFQQSTTVPAGFKNSVVATSLSAYSVGASDFFQLTQGIEGLNVSDFGWGTADATAVTLSFWVRSSLTGTFGGAFRNNALNRSYPFTYTISSANTWEKKIITVAGDTSGTWLTTNSVGIRLTFGLGNGSTYSGTANTWASANYQNATGATSLVGTNGATFYITGVQLEKGSTATSFDFRSYGDELYLCQRYFWPFIFGDSAGQTPGPVGFGESTTTFIAPLQYPQTMRATPTISTTNAAADFRARYGGSSITCSAVPYGVNINNMACWLLGTVASGITVSNLYALSGNNSNVKLNFNAEL